MQVFNQEVYDIVEKGLQGNGLTFDETRTLYAVPYDSKEAALIRWAGQKLSMEAANGKAEIHAQIGLDSGMCPMNCVFCSFARSSCGRAERIELPRQDVVDYAQIYEESGANVILLLSTAGYRFEKLCEMAQAVREVISTDMPLLVNTGDLSLEQAKTLKSIGVNGAYHAARMREGADTGIPLERRLATLDNLKAASLKLSTCVEPVGPEHTPEEITEATFRCIERHPLSGGAARRVGVPGTAAYERGMVTETYNADMVAIYRLACGRSMRLNCSANTPLTASSGANLAWSEVGLNPRDNMQRTEHGGRASNIQLCRKIFKSAGWEILDGPSPGWM